MMDIRYELKGLIDKYRAKVVEKMRDPDVLSEDEADMHTDFIHRCSRGDANARNYVMNKIRDYLMILLTSEDRQALRKLVLEHFIKVQNKEYEKVNLENIDHEKEEAFITYYQLIEKFGSNKQTEFFSCSKESIDEIKVLAMEIYKIEYGTSLIEELMYMRVNNIEVHGTRKIRVETNEGIWFTIKDYHFKDKSEVRRIAFRLFNEEDNPDITEEDCEKEGRLLNGARLTIALTPASAEDNIFIKKFDSVDVTIEEMMEFGTITKQMIDDLRILTKGRANAVIIGGVNTGKSTFGKVYVGLYPKHYKIGLVDNAKDTDIQQMYSERDIITLYETDKYDANYQFSKLLRANRHILVIAEARGHEVLEMIKAMTRGNAGSFCTIHSTNAESVINNIAWMCLENGIPQDVRVLRERIADAVDIIIRLRHFEDLGIRVVDEVVEIISRHDNLDRPFELKKIYEWDNEKKCVVKVKGYTPSEELERKLRYFGCSSEEIKILQRDDINGKCN